MRRRHSKRRWLTMGIVLMISFSGCVPDDITGYDFKQDQPPSTLLEDKGDVLVGEQEASGLTVALYIDKGAHTGYNRLRVRLTDTSGMVVKTAQVGFQPTYELAGVGRSVPFANPSSSQANEKDFFEGGAFFLPPEPGAGTFSVDVTFQAGSSTGTVSFPLAVEESLWMQRVQGGEGLYFVSWVRPERPVVGDNVFEIALHREPDYAPIPNVNIDLYPYMDMGGGDGHSTPYQAPTHKNGGNYSGTVNFIMSGGWDMTVYVQHPDGSTNTALFADYTVY